MKSDFITLPLISLLLILSLFATCKTKNDHPCNENGDESMFECMELDVYFMREIGSLAAFNQKY